MFHFVEWSIHGGHSNCVHRHEIANNHYMENFDSEAEIIFYFISI